MIFNSYSFLFLVFITLIFYYATPLRRFQPVIIITGSLVFYACNNPKLTLLLIAIALINGLFSYLVHINDSPRKKAFAWAGVILNIAVLVFFKYSHLLSITFFPSGSSIGHFLIMFPLPAGISFYIFKSISLIVDTYRGKVDYLNVGNPTYLNHGIRSLFYISFFPQIMAGPIARADDFMAQIKIKFYHEIDWEYCVKLIITGYFLKMVVADNLKDHTFWIQYPYFSGLPTLTLVTMIYGYSIQIFADFAGYSLVSIGIAGIFGYRVPDNFNFPYIAASFSEFWRRWHISLSSFLRDYLYIPLGGNRRGKIWTYINLMIVMTLGGLWHGAGWSYAVWGVFHGTALAVERFFKNFIHLPKLKIINATRIAIVFTFVSCAWIFFKLPNFSDAVHYFISIYSNIDINVASGLNRSIIVNCLLFSIPVLIYHAGYQLKHIAVLRKQYILEKSYLLYGLMLFLIITNSGSSSAFIYFQF